MRLVMVVANTVVIIMGGDATEVKMVIVMVFMKKVELKS